MNGVRPIQLVAARLVSSFESVRPRDSNEWRISSPLKNPRGAGRVPGYSRLFNGLLETLTIDVPEPGSTMALRGALGLNEGLFGLRRRLF